MPCLEVCALNDIDEEDVVRFDHSGSTFAVYRMIEGDVYCTDVVQIDVNGKPRNIEQE